MMLSSVLGSGATTYGYNGNLQRSVVYEMLSGRTTYTVFDESGSPLAELDEDYRVDREYLRGPTGTLVTVRDEELAREIDFTSDSRAVLISWIVPGCDVGGVNIWRSTSVGGPYTLLTPAPVGGSAFQDTTAQPRTQYFYKMKRRSSVVAPAIRPMRLRTSTTQGRPPVIPTQQTPRFTAT